MKIETMLEYAQEIEAAPRILQDWKVGPSNYLLSEEWLTKDGFVDLILAWKQKYRRVVNHNPILWANRLQYQEQMLERFLEFANPFLDYEWQEVLAMLKKPPKKLLAHPALAAGYLKSRPYLDLIRDEETLVIRGTPMYRSTSGLWLASDWPYRGFRTDTGLSAISQYRTGREYRKLKDVLGEGGLRYRRTGKQGGGWTLINDDLAHFFAQWAENTSLLRL